MAMRYTYDDFDAEVKKRGMGTQFSDADLKLAMANPDAGMSLLNYKTDYANATTDEARALANEGAESIRSAYGGYTGGADGSSFYVDQPSPKSYVSGQAPTYSSNWADTIKQNYNKVAGYGDFVYDLPAPEYKDTYADKRAELLEGITNYDPFSYDYASDPVYQAYAKQYRREGQRAAEDTLAAASAATGGMPSSYAVTASQQAGNYYGSQLADKIPELYSQAYDRWLNEFSRKQNALAAVQGESASEYDRYLTDLGQYNTDRSFAYQQYADEYERLANALSQSAALEQMDYAKYQDQLNQFNTDRSFGYAQHLDEIADQRYKDETEYNRAMDAASIGDYRALEELGIDTSALASQAEADRLAAELERQYRQEQIAGMQWERDFNERQDAYDREQDALAWEYQQNQDAYNRDRQEMLDALDREYTQAQIAGMRQNQSDADYARRMELAELAAASGDYRYLQELGIDTEGLAAGNGGYTQGELLAALSAASEGKADADDYDVLIRAGYLDENGSPTDALMTRGMTESDAQKLAAKGDSGLLSESEWKKLKAYGYSAPIMEFASYEEYLSAVLPLLGGAQGAAMIGADRLINGLK